MNFCINKLSVFIATSAVIAAGTGTAFASNDFYCPAVSSVQQVNISPNEYTYKAISPDGYLYQDSTTHSKTSGSGIILNFESAVLSSTLTLYCGYTVANGTSTYLSLNTYVPNIHADMQAPANKWAQDQTYHSHSCFSWGQMQCPLSGVGS